MKTIFTGNDIYLGRYKTKLENWIFVFLNENKYKYEIIVHKKDVETFMKEYKIKKNLFYLND